MILCYFPFQTQQKNPFCTGSKKLITAHFSIQRVEKCWKIFPGMPTVRPSNDFFLNFFGMWKSSPISWRSCSQNCGRAWPIQNLLECQIYLVGFFFKSAKISWFCRYVYFITWYLISSLSHKVCFLMLPLLKGPKKFTYNYALLSGLILLRSNKTICV